VPYPPEMTIVHTRIGEVHGTSKDGIPYAQAPVKDLRWRPPQPPLPWEGVLDATSFGHTSWSFLVGDDNSNADEDCLNLNIWAPSTNGNANLPVMVYIHEGGFVFGNGSKANLDGQRLAQRGVVVVTFNYRLGVFGFLALHDLDEEGSNSGMFGLQDQQAALHWVQSHISSFGGDPNNVTVFGESAGAHSIGILMSSPASEGLFHKAILQSGAFWNQVFEHDMDFIRAREHGKTIFDRLDVSSLAELRDVPARSLVAHYPFDFSSTPDQSNFAPSVDNNVLPQKALRVFQSNDQMQIPMLAGFASDEGTLFKNLLAAHPTKEQFELTGKAIGGPELYAQFLSLYPTDASGAPLPKSIIDFVGDLYLAHQTWKAATSQIAAGVENVYMYLFSYTSEYNPMAIHASDINFTFGMTPRYEVAMS
jgi:para-nitrobenzyl esterase